MNRAERRRREKAEKKVKGVKAPLHSGTRSRASIQQALNIAIQHHSSGNLSDAKKGYENVLQIEPKNPIALHFLGMIAHQVGRFDTSIDLISKALAVAPDYDAAHNTLGLAYRDVRNTTAAIASFQKAIAINPGLAEAHNNLGNLYQSIGEISEAESSFRKAIAVKPDFAEAYQHLCAIKRYSDHGPELDVMENLFKSPGTSDGQKIHLGFGLGKAFDDLKEYEKAFQYLSNANTLMRKTFEYDTSQTQKCFAQLMEIFTNDFLLKHTNSGVPDETPIFVLGMPRSGTTLVEQILSSHPDVHGAGELTDFYNVVTSAFGDICQATFSDAVNNADSELIGQCADDYILKIREHSHSARYIINKLPHNFVLIGMIKMMLPNAKIIHCRRNAMDTCLSIYRQKFTGNGHHYAYDLRELGEYYLLYTELMTYWRNLFHGDIFEIEYEDIVQNQNEQTVALLEYCNLEWDDACLNFHKTKKVVQTASAAQVRRPIYNSSVLSWKKYEKELAPLSELLQAQTQDLEDGC